MIGPFLGQAISGHDLCQIIDVGGTLMGSPIISGCTALQVVGPFSGIFEVINVVTEMRKTDKVLKIIPGYSPQGWMLGNQSRDNDAHQDCKRKTTNRSFSRTHG